MGSATSSTISIGTLVLDIYDPGTKQLVWTGHATKSIDPSSNQEKNMKNLNKAMAKLLKNVKMAVVLVSTRRVFHTAQIDSGVRLLHISCTPFHSKSLRDLFSNLHKTFTVSLN